MIILCPNCHNHLGWRYMADENSSLIPRMFYGLCMRSITSAKNYLLPDRNVQRMEEISNEGMLVAL